MQKQKKMFLISFTAVAVFFVVLVAMSLFLVDFTNISLAMNENEFYASDLAVISKKDFFGKAITSEIEVGAANDGSGKLVLKFFNLFKIKAKDIKVVPTKTVFVGGDIIAMRLKSKGVYVSKISKVKTDDGEKLAFSNGDILEGDILEKINDKEILTLSDISKEVENSEGELKIILSRNGETKEVNVTALIESVSKTKKLGIYVRDDFGGIGTLTFVDEESMKFGALGHSITVNNSNIPTVFSGEIMKATIIGCEKGEKGKAGEIKAFENLTNEAKLGEVKKNSQKGVFGIIKSGEFVSKMAKYEVGGRFSVKPGKAQIISQTDGGLPVKYDIQILKCSKQQTSQSRGMVIKVTDKRLINKTGGIIQGMSGSPIIQNDKIIGAVTHVFLNDSLKGYGLYFDFMFEEIVNI